MKHIILALLWGLWVLAIWLPTHLLPWSAPADPDIYGWPHEVWGMAVILSIAIAQGLALGPILRPVLTGKDSSCGS